MVHVGSLNLSDISLTQMGSFDENFKTSTPRTRKDISEQSLYCSRNSSDNLSQISRVAPGPAPPKPNTPKPQTAVTKSRVEGVDIAFPERSLRKICSAKELWIDEKNSSGNGKSNITSILKRRHSEIFNHRFTTSIYAGQRTLEIVREESLCNQSNYSRCQSGTSLCGLSDFQRRSFDRNCPARRARRSRVFLGNTSDGTVDLTITSSVSSPGLTIGKVSNSKKKNGYRPSISSLKRRISKCKISLVSL